MTTTKLMANSSLEESIVTVNKRVWVKPAVELISVQSGSNPRLHEASTTPASQFRFIS